MDVRSPCEFCKSLIRQGQDEAIAWVEATEKNSPVDPVLREASWHRERQHWPWLGDWPQMEGAIMERHEGRMTRAERMAWTYDYHINLGASNLSKFSDSGPRIISDEPIEDEPLVDDDARIDAATTKKIDQNRNNAVPPIPDYTQDPVQEFAKKLHEKEYPKLCYETFIHAIPVFPYELESDKGFSRALNDTIELFEYWNTILPKKLKIEFEKKNTSPPSIKKMREDPTRHYYWREYLPPLTKDPRELYKGTPIGELLVASSEKGSRVLNYLWTCTQLDSGPVFTKESGVPNRENLIKFFALLEGKGGEPDYRGGSELFNLLKTYKVLVPAGRPMSNQMFFLNIRCSCYSYCRM